MLASHDYHTVLRDQYIVSRWKIMPTEDITRDLSTSAGEQTADEYSLIAGTGIWEMTYWSPLPLPINWKQCDMQGYL
jgi:hypothetical protein